VTATFFFREQVLFTGAVAWLWIVLATVSITRKIYIMFYILPINVYINVYINALMDVWEYIDFIVKTY